MFVDVAPLLITALLVVSTGSSFVLRPSSDVVLARFSSALDSAGVTFTLLLIPLEITDFFSESIGGGSIIESGTDSVLAVTSFPAESLESISCFLSATA